jgi:hypothetical protein
MYSWQHILIWGYLTRPVSTWTQEESQEVEKGLERRNYKEKRRRNIHKH